MYYVNIPGIITSNLNLTRWYRKSVMMENSSSEDKSGKKAKVTVAVKHTMFRFLFDLCYFNRDDSVAMFMTSIKRLCRYLVWSSLLGFITTFYWLQNIVSFPLTFSKKSSRNIEFARNLSFSNTRKRALMRYATSDRRSEEPGISKKRYIICV